MDSFYTFLCRIVVTIIQSHNLEYPLFNFEMFSSLIKIAIEVNRSVLDDIIMPAIGINIANVFEIIVEADPKKISVIIINIFFLFKDFYFFS